MENRIFEDFLAETVEGFTSLDCRSCVLSNMMIEKLREKTLDETMSIFKSLPKDLQEHLRVFLTDIYIENLLDEN